MTNWKFSWGPFYNIYEPNVPPNRTTDSAVPIYDPPHGDYYSKPSQPKYVPTSEMPKVVSDKIGCGPNPAFLASKIIARDRAKIERWRGTAATITAEIERVRRESLLKRQEFAEPFAVPYYFWLGIDAEHRLW